MSKHKNFFFRKKKIAALSSDFTKYRWYAGAYLSVSKYKGLEVTVSIDRRSLHSLFNLWAGWTIKGDHPGVRFEFNLLWFGFDFSLYDGRHWHWDEDRFYEPGEDFGDS